MTAPEEQAPLDRFAAAVLGVGVLLAVVVLLLLSMDVVG